MKEETTPDLSIDDYQDFPDACESVLACMDIWALQNERFTHTVATAAWIYAFVGACLVVMEEKEFLSLIELSMKRYKRDRK